MAEKSMQNVTQAIKRNALYIINPTLRTSQTITVQKAQKHSAKQIKSQFAFEMVTDEATICEIQCFRAKIFSQAYGVYFENKRDSDVYDPYSLHAIVRDRETGQIAAYTRIIPPLAKEKLAKYYSEYEFDINDFLNNKEGVYELGRTCVDIPYRGSNALKVLWLGMAKVLILQLKAQYLIGCVSVNVDPTHQRIMATEHYLHKKAQIGAFISYKPFYVSSNAHFEKTKYKHKVPSLLKKYRRIGATFSAQGYYDQMFNCVDYFSCIKVNRSLIMKLNLVCKMVELKAKLKMAA